MLVHPPQLNARVFHSQESVDKYNAAVAAYLAQQEQAEYNSTHNNKSNKRQSRKSRFEEQE